MPTKAELEKRIQELRETVQQVTSEKEELERAAECCHEECHYFEERLDRADDLEEQLETLSQVMDPDLWDPVTQAAWNRSFPASCMFGGSLSNAFRELRIHAGINGDSRL